jgi:hypothetical protein
MSAELDPDLSGEANPCGPVGSDRGADVRRRYDEWRQANREMDLFLPEVCRDWKMPDPGLPAPTEEQVHERLARGDPGPVLLDETVIAFAFCQLISDRAVSSEDRRRALEALERQGWPCVMEWQGWTHPEYRREMLAKMREALGAAEGVPRRPGGHLMTGGYPRLSADDRGVWREDGPGQASGIAWEDICYVGGSKVDALTEVFTAVDLESEHGQQRFPLCSHWPGFGRVVREITARLPGIDPSWFEEIEALDLRQPANTVWSRAEPGAAPDRGGR